MPVPSGPVLPVEGSSPPQTFVTTLTFPNHVQSVVEDCKGGPIARAYTRNLLLRLPVRSGPVLPVEGSSPPETFVTTRTFPNHVQSVVEDCKGGPIARAYTRNLL